MLPVGVEKEERGESVPYGGEFWKRVLSDEDEGGVSAGAANPGLGTPVDLTSVIERACHAWKDRRVRGAGYRAALVSGGFRLDTEAPRSVGAVVRTHLPDEAVLDSEWVIAGNVAQRVIGAESGLIEHLEARGEGMALTWILPSALPGERRHFRVELEVAGLSHTGGTASGHHFAGADGLARVRVGSVLLVDTAGKTRAVDTRYDERLGRLVIEIPEKVLGQAVYPLAIDPAIGPEFGIDGAAGELAPAAAPEVATNGESYLVVSEAEVVDGVQILRQIRGTLLSRDGTVIKHFKIGGLETVESGSYRAILPAVASNGTDYLVVWSDNRSRRPCNCRPPPDDLMGARVDGRGAVMDPEGFVITNVDERHLFPDVASDGQDYLVVWEHGVPGEFTKIRAKTVGADGTVSDPSQPGVELGLLGTQVHPRVAYTRGIFLVVWGIGANFPGAILVDRAGDPIGEAFAVGPDQRNLAFPQVGANGSGFLVVWRQQVPGGQDVYGTLVSPEGEVGVPEGRVIGEDVDFVDSSMAVSGSGGGFLVQWVAGGVLRGACVLANGQVSGTEGEILSLPAVTRKVVSAPRLDSGGLERCSLCRRRDPIDSFCGASRRRESAGIAR